MAKHQRAGLVWTPKKESNVPHSVRYDVLNLARDITCTFDEHGTQHATPEKIIEVYQKFMAAIDPE